MSALLVFIGGGFGSVTRFLLSKHFLFNTSFLNATIIVNILGSFLIGIIFALIGKAESSSLQNIYFLAATGFLGGFTTFSTFSLDFLNLVNNQQITSAIIYLLATVTLSILAVSAGFFIFR